MSAILEFFGMNRKREHEPPPEPVFCKVHGAVHPSVIKVFGTDTLPMCMRCYHDSVERAGRENLDETIPAR